MKLNKLFIALVSILLLQSCLFQEKDLFDKSANERVEEAVENLYDVLISAPNGWKLVYHTVPGTYGSYNMLMSFDKEKVAMQGDKLFESGKHSSYYTINRSQGAVLDFNEYNKVISLLANGAVYNNGRTLGGDNEFVWQRTSIDRDTIFFKSKKQSAEVQLIRLDENQGWDQYLNPINAVMNEFSAGDLNRYFKILNFDDGSNLVLGGYDDLARSVNVLYLKENGELGRTTRAVDFVKDGFSFYEPLEFEGKMIQYVPYSTESGTFSLTVDGVNGQLIPSSLPPFVIPGDLNEKLFIKKEGSTQNDYYMISLVSQLRLKMRAAVEEKKLSPLDGLFLYPDPLASDYAGMHVYCLLLTRVIEPYASIDNPANPNSHAYDPLYNPNTDPRLNPFAATRLFAVNKNVNGRSDTFRFIPIEESFPGVFFNGDEGRRHAEYWNLLKDDFMELSELFVGETDGFIAIPDEYFQSITFGPVNGSFTFGVEVQNY